MGGTFDPIHHGHLVAASEVQQSFDLDEVVFVPTGQPWMKEAVSSPERRYEMTVIATASNPRFSVSRVDIERGGQTYTIDTLRDIRRERPDAELFFISGADAVAQILDWKDVEELLAARPFRRRVPSWASPEYSRIAGARRKLARGTRVGNLFN